jgi:hypothetical protein
MKLFVTITFHYNESKLPYLKKVVNSINQIESEHTKIIICTNQKFDIDGAELDVIERLYHPFFLAWCHKRHMIHFLDTDYTHFMYLEDDILVTPETMKYWLRNRDLFKRNNLPFMPAVVRIEYDSKGQAFSLDSIQSDSIDKRPIVTVEGQKFISLSSPYQAMFIMDRELVEEHIRSKSFMYATATPFNGAWLIQDLAAQGNMYENIPLGFEHRYLVPIDNFSECWVHHTTDTYVNISQSSHSKLPANMIFI